MLRNAHSLIIILLCFVVFPLFPQQNAKENKRQENWMFSAAPHIGGLFGTTSYLLDAESVKSYLEFPLNTLIGGVEVHVSPPDHLLSEWSFTFAAYTNVWETYSVMEDHDWYTDPEYPDIKFSYTESDPEMDMYQFEIKGEKPFFSFDNLILLAESAYTYQYVHQIINNLKGWQYEWNDSLGTDGAYELYTLSLSDTEALDYRIHFHRFSGGMTSVWRYGHVLFELGLCAEVLYVHDKDDHILRNKEATTSGFGLGGTGFIEGELTFPDYSASYTPFFALKTRYSYLHASVEGTQEWYGDDPATPNTDDTGSEISGLDYTISSEQFFFDLLFGVRW